MRTCQNYIPVKGIILMDRAIIFGRAAGILSVASNPKNRLSDEDNRILGIAAEDMKKIVGDMKFVTSKRRELDPDFPPIKFTLGQEYSLMCYLVHCAYHYLANELRPKGIIINPACWMHFKPIFDTVETIRKGHFETAEKDSVRQGIEFFRYLKERFWDEGQSRVNAERMKEDTD
ncbi:MAG: hypothetical protein WC618_05480 [Patescibacteria group bacterium]